MELMAVIEGLRALKSSSSVDLYSDSQYVLNGLKMDGFLESPRLAPPPTRSS